MTILRVTTLIGGPYVAGGGIAQHYFQNVGTSAQLVTAVRGFWFAMAAFVGSGTTFAVQGTIDEVDELTGDLEGNASTAGGTETGTGAGDVLPLQCQGLIHWRTGTVADGRELRGRTFIPAGLESASTGAVPSAAYVAQLNTAGNQLMNDVNTSLVVWRRPRPARPQVGSPGDPWYLRAQTARQGSFAVVSGVNGASQWATLRGRRVA